MISEKEKRVGERKKNEGWERVFFLLSFFPPLTPTVPLFPSFFTLPPYSRDHEATLAAVRAAQAEADGHAADSAVLTAFAHSARVARAAAEGELRRTKKAAEAGSETWRRRLEARRREV